MSAYHIHSLQYLTKKATGLPLCKYSSVGAMYSYAWKCIYNGRTPDRSEYTSVPSSLLTKTALMRKTVNWYEVPLICSASFGGNTTFGELFTTLCMLLHQYISLWQMSYGYAPSYSLIRLTVRTLCTSSEVGKAFEVTQDAWYNVRQVNCIPIKIRLALVSAYHIHSLQYLTKKRRVCHCVNIHL